MVNIFLICRNLLEPTVFSILVIVVQNKYCKYLHTANIHEHWNVQFARQMEFLSLQVKSNILQ